MKLDSFCKYDCLYKGGPDCALPTLRQRMSGVMDILGASMAVQSPESRPSFDVADMMMREPTTDTARLDAYTDALDRRQEALDDRKTNVADCIAQHQFIAAVERL